MNNRRVSDASAGTDGSSLPLTGERTVPGIAEENYWFSRHLVAYEYITSYCQGKRVLDTGAGEGYGAALLSQYARNVVAIDYDPTVIDYINSTYPTVTAVLGNLYQLDQLTLTDQLFDVIVNFQVIEHLWDQDKFIVDAAHFLTATGTLLISTPNRLTFSPGSTSPLNPFHTRELSAHELQQLLADNGFTDITLLGIHHSPRICEYEHQQHQSMMDAQISAIVAHGEYSPELLEFIQSINTSDFIIKADDIDKSLDLLAVAIKR